MFSTPLSRRIVSPCPPPSAVELNEIDAALAAARIVIALLFAMLLVTALPLRAELAAGVAYVAYAMAIYVGVRSGAVVSPAARFALHAGDLLVPVALGWVAPDAIEIANVLYLVPLAAAALRWGGGATLATLAGALTVAILSGRPDGPTLASHPVAGLLVGGTLAVLFALTESRRRLETAAVADLFARCAVATGFTWSLRTALDGLTRLFDATGGAVVANDARSGRTFLWTLASLGDTESPLRRTEITGRPHLTATRMDQPAHDGVLAAEFVAGEWSGRVELFEREPPRKRTRSAAYFTRAVRELTPVLHSAYLGSRARAQAAKQERARLARALHDGSIQSLIGAEMQIAAVCRRAEGDGDDAQELRSAQAILRREILNLRELMTQMKPLEVAAEELPECLSRIVDRFSQDSGIPCEFSADRLPAGPDQHRCVELARIVQEALSNARKHSGATRIQVSLRSYADTVSLVIQDNGRGFAFEGLLAITDGVRLPGTRVPEAILESVRLFGGGFVIQSKPGHGARLEITVPWRAAASSAGVDRVAS